MSFWKVLGGAAIGVGAIAAAPFTGGGSIVGAATLATSLAGAGTVAAAVGAGVAGAAVGASMDDNGDIYEKGRQEGRVEGKAESAIEIDDLRSKLESIVTNLKESSDYFQSLYAMEAVAIAVANCDGEICHEERDQIEDFVAGVSRSNLPFEVKERIESLYKNPLNIKEAFEMARKTDIEFSVFETIINVVMHADGIEHTEEKAFVQAWNELKAAA